MLRQRIITATVLLAVVLPVLFLAPPVAWGLLSLAALVLAAGEWQRLIEPQAAVAATAAAAVTAVPATAPVSLGAAGAPASVGVGTGAGASAATAVPSAALRPSLPWIVGVAGLAFLGWRLFTAPGQLSDPAARPGPASALFALPVVETLLAVSVLLWLAVCIPSIVQVRARATRPWFGAAALLAMYVALYELRLVGAAYLVGAMAIVWCADIGAYFAGRAFGRHKLAPRISPGKSWEGAIGGALAAVAVAAAVWLAAPGVPALTNDLARATGLVPMLLCVVLVVALSVTGDLYESLLKRERGVKDSGTLFPGHGGVLDRIDAMVPTMPLCVLLWLLAR